MEYRFKENEPVSEYPAVIVEPIPCARVEQGYAAQIFVYDDETYLLQDVAEEQEIETETVKTGQLCGITCMFRNDLKSHCSQWDTYKNTQVWALFGDSLAPKDAN
ncbi:ETS-related transcription factor Elf-2-like isoform X2 [Erythrolamprus reginae]|uniref:ETS-related transcription factor Elf-2-like isoform X2 n=1 Tax=Erythrolamprus reginae TaxID=121349 RepID=UPI00396C3633